MKISIAALACIGWCVQLTSSFQTPSTRSPLSTTISHDRSVGGWSSSSTTTKTTALVPNKKSFDANNRLSTTQLDASPLSALASSPLGAISVLAGIVVVHEAGHYLAARSYNITVEEFSVGFGPKLVGFEALGNEFNLRALPLGGYVRFPINYDVNATQKMENAAREAFMKRREEEEWGPVQDAVNLLTLGIWDDRRRKQKNQELATQAEEEMAKRNWFQKLTGSGRLSKVVKDDPEDFEIDYYDDPDLLQNRPWFQRAVVLSMGVIFNMILAFSLYFGEIRFGSGIPEPQFGSGVVVSQAPLKSGAADGLLKQGDVIVGINGNPLVLMTSKGPAGAQKQVGDVISAIRATPDGESVNLQIKRGGDSNNNNNNIDIAIKPKKADMASSPSIGVMLSPKFLETKKLSSDNTVEAAQMAYSYFAGVFQQTLDGFLTLVGTLLMGKGPPPGQSVSGPVGLIKTGTDVVSTKDLATVLAFAGALSVNLGVINALPLPALDGGQLLFVLAEAVTGRKIDQRIQEGITSAAVLLLLFFTLSTTFSDVGNILVSFNFK